MEKLKHILLVTVFCSLLAAGAADFKASLELPRSAVRLGEYIQLVLNSGKRIDRIDYPEVPGARWAKNIQSSSTRYINGQVSHMKTLYLAPEKEGTFTIPPFKVYSGTASAQTREVQVRVLPRQAPVTEGGKSYKLSDLVRGSISISPRGRAVYAGEEMTITCDLLVDERFSNQVRLSYYPEFSNVANALFTTWDVRGGKVRFRAAEPAQVVEKDNTFMRYRFTALCRVLKPGAFDPGVSIRVGIVQRSSRGGDPFDDFFGDMGGFFGSRVENYKVDFRKAPAVDIRPLPPVPAGVESTSLVGKWQAAGVLSGNKLRQGEVCELTLNFKGEGAAEDFHAPKIDLPGFRVYPPEVTKSAGAVTAKYALIPLETGEVNIKLSPAYFDSAKGKWQSTPLSFKAVVAKGNAAAPAPVQQNFAAPEKKSASAKAAEEESSRLLYQKNAPGMEVKVPLIANSIWLILFFGLVCPLAAVGIELFFRRREKEANSPELRKKKALAGEIRKLAAELKRNGDSPELRSRLVPLLGEAMGLSAGVSAGELAAHMKEEELCAYFSQLDLAGFRPGAEDDAPVLTPAGKKALLKLLKRLSCLAVMLGIVCSAAAAGINEQFNKGEFAQAAATYLKAARTPSGWRPDMLYNYGNAQYRLNNLPEARRALTLAALLKPWDGEIRANLHFVNSRLFQNGNSTGSFSAALREMRDQIRFDHYLLLAAFFWGAFWLIWSFRRKISKGIFYSTSSFLILFCLLCLFSGFAQYHSTFSPRRMIVTEKSAQLRTLPGRIAGEAEASLTGGSEGEVIEYDNSGYARVRVNGREGWLPVASFKTLIAPENQ